MFLRPLPSSPFLLPLTWPWTCLAISLLQGSFTLVLTSWNYSFTLGFSTSVFLVMWGKRSPCLVGRLWLDFFLQLNTSVTNSDWFYSLFYIWWMEGGSGRFCVLPEVVQVGSICSKIQFQSRDSEADLLHTISLKNIRLNYSVAIACDSS